MESRGGRARVKPAKQALLRPLQVTVTSPIGLRGKLATCQLSDHPECSRTQFHLSDDSKLYLLVLEAGAILVEV
jgi:hypothetical protein